MNIQAQQLLKRWQSIERGPGFQKAQSVARVLSLIGLALLILVIVGVVYKLHPAVIAAAALANGWVTAETNALRTRLSQWPIIRKYIDWERVEKDLNDGHNG